MTSFIQQNLISPDLDIAPRSISLRKLAAKDVNVITRHILDNDTAVLGVSLRTSAKDGRVDLVAFATGTHVFQVTLGQASPVGSNCKDDLSQLLASARCQLVAFDMARLALHLYKQFGVRVHGVDLSTLFSTSTAAPDTPADLVSTRLHPNINRHRIHALWHDEEERSICLRAWLAALIAESSEDAVLRALKVDTDHLPKPHLQCLADLMTNVALLEAEKPTQAENEFEGVVLDGDGQLVIQNARYNTRVRRSKQTTVVLETTHGRTITGHAVHAEGKRTGVAVHGGNFRGDIQSIRTVGREEPTLAERARDEFILRLLRGEVRSLVQSAFVRALWFPEGPPGKGRRTGSYQNQREGGDDGDEDADDEYGWSMSFAMLNAAQKEVVRAMWSDDEPLVVVHGPPGTGKTRTIAVALEEWGRCGEPTWVIAQSNVGVKNIARTLIKHDVDFKLIVSKEFYVEWHEHLYETIEQHLIRSDDLIVDPVAAERFIGGSAVILCTVSMLSNPGLDSCGMYHLVPVERLVVDEASQIDSFEFMHLFHKFRVLQKVCMFGDPKQLPPFGKETAPLMKTIFDFKHLKPSAYFLNTQYRMPLPLGEFISEEVYNSKLKSVRKITDTACVRFVDVRKGTEESMDPGWKNTEEVHAVVNIVKNYYKRLDFCIITPYDAQRNAIAQRLKQENLPWESVYNVDSFQGHEAPYVIVSTVRTTRPGFLCMLNRMNVMLTRCSAGMVLVTNRRFLADAGRDTLLGKLARRWNGPRDSDAWVDALALSLSDGRRASLPGAPATTAISSHPLGGGGLGASLAAASRSHSSTGLDGILGVVPARTAVLRAVARLAVPATATHVHIPLPRPSLSISNPVEPREPRYGYPTAVDGSEHLSAKLGAMRVVGRGARDGSDAFPALGGVSPKKKASAPMGRWRAGSDACRL
ncbi:hypothetical protein GSI_08318 [Ganoderma sinense ZZ0214-1]|uniref:DNA2/NAM7 helicase-like C-terminal domain-containing protein n=1 Tax=Ganoderma sinense ZZ0214-1 TaxID=1077348 RepID=A0A2G8S6V8_9APHY|nr:hypothetical protein GSI_08318 [Ganoderma sinense ZZ0214-1]